MSVAMLTDFVQISRQCGTTMRQTAVAPIVENPTSEYALLTVSEAPVVKAQNPTTFKY